MNKKALSPVVAVALLLITTVVAVTSFQTWYTNYSSSLFTNVETRDSDGENLRVEQVLGEVVYLKTGKAENLTFFRVRDSNGNELCRLDTTTTLDKTNLVAHYKFDSIIDNGTHNYTQDFSGNGYNATLHDENSSNSDGATIAQIVEGRIGNALEFDGADDLVMVRNGSSAMQNVNFTTVISMIRPKNEVCRPYSEFISNNHYPHAFRISPSEILEDPFPPSGNSLNNLTRTDFQNKIFSVYSFSRNNSNLRYFENGLLMGNRSSAQVSTSDINTVGSSHIGASYRVPFEQYHDCTQDETLIFNRTLSDDEVKAFSWDLIKQLKVGSTRIDISECSLNLGENYEVFVTTDTASNQFKFVNK